MAGLAGFGGRGTQEKYPSMDRWELSLTRNWESWVHLVSWRVMT